MMMAVAVVVVADVAVVGGRFERLRPLQLLDVDDDVHLLKIT